MSLADQLLSVVSGLARHWPWLNRTANSIAINSRVNVGRNRPHPWSTRTDYVSWSALSDRTYYARLLPADASFPEIESLGSKRPPISEVVKLFAATGAQRTCPKSTCLFPAFAQYLTDGFLRTSLINDDTKSDRRRTTSYHDIDLSQLYGRTGVQTSALRLGSEATGERGRLRSQIVNGEEYPPLLHLPSGEVDPLFESLDVPLGIDHASAEGLTTLFAVGGDRVNAGPQIAMINTLLLREHNRLAAVIETTKPGWGDERVFETARNCVIVMFIKIVVEEYINHINSTPFKLQALPEISYRAKWNRPNWITIEFALLYRWHSLVPENVVWARREVQGTDTLLNNSVLVQYGLVAAFADVSANGATELGLQNSATFLQRAELKALEQSRLNRVATFADYCRAMGKTVPRDFAALVGSSPVPAEQSRRSALATELSDLYGSVENVEFYVGLFAEPQQRNSPLPDLIGIMVAMDAFSQALTNPLLSEHVWGDPAVRRSTFTDAGLAAITNTSCLNDVLARNTTDRGNRFVGMTKPEWKRS